MKIEDKIQRDIVLAPFATFRIGGPAKFFVEVITKEELKQALAWAKAKGETVRILGGMSNVLINDNGVNGLVIKMSNNKLSVKGARIDVEAGAEFNQLVNCATANCLTGLEWAAGIPGSVGGAVRGNAGAFGYNMSDCVETVDVYEIKEEKSGLLSKKDCRFDYRDSLFKHDKNLIIWQITVKLNFSNGQAIKDLATKNLNYRLKTQPKLPSAGCVFKNLQIKDLSKDNNLLTLAKNKNVIKGDKISTGWVINQLDLGGKKIGNAKISLEHNNFIVNSGRATADDIAVLISYIKQQVRNNFRINLEEEIELIGF